MDASIRNLPGSRWSSALSDCDPASDYPSGAETTGCQGLLPHIRRNLFLAHYAIAEMKYFLRLGIPLPPPYWFDSFVAAALLDERTEQFGSRAVGFVASTGPAPPGPRRQEALRKTIVNLQFNADNPAERQEIVDYCFSDCDGCAALYPHIQDQVPAATLAHWMEYLKAVARMELRGLPIDIETYELIHRHQSEIRAAGWRHKPDLARFPGRFVQQGELLRLVYGGGHCMAC